MGAILTIIVSIIFFSVTRILFKKEFLFFKENLLEKLIKKHICEDKKIISRKLANKISEVVK